MAQLKGKTVYTLFTEIVEDGCTVRQTVECYEDKADAVNELEMVAQDETERCGKEHPDWQMAVGSDTYFECCKEDDLHRNHSTAKIVANVVK